MTTLACWHLPNTVSAAYDVNDNSNNNKSTSIGRRVMPGLHETCISSLAQISSLAFAQFQEQAMRLNLELRPRLFF